VNEPETSPPQSAVEEMATPRSDAQFGPHQDSLGSMDCAFARQLERELAQTIRERNTLRSDNLRIKTHLILAATNTDENPHDTYEVIKKTDLQSLRAHHAELEKDIASLVADPDLNTALIQNTLLEQKIAELQAIVDKMREALEEIARGFPYSSRVQIIDAMQKRANEALAPSGKETK
jgi:hypothetical protein